jgi:hypothetical protein
MARPREPSNEEALLQSLRKLAGELAESASNLSGRKATAVRKEIGSVVQELARVMVGLDPVREPESIFDPANPRTVGRFVGIALVAQDRHPLSSVPAFYGSGVYALYYDGPYAPYALIVSSENPIYVGKADPANPAAKTPREQEQRLSGRLKDHARTVRKAASTLDIAHFTCRYLIVQSGWQTAAEDYLINLFKPIWNDEIGICYGIGKHGDDPGTRGNLRSPWDTLHPGRDWAHRDQTIRDARPREQILAGIGAHFQLHAPYVTVEAVLKQFFDDLKQR